MCKIYTFFHTKTQTTIPFGMAHNHIPCVGEFPFPLPSPGSWDGHKMMWVSQISDKSITLSISIVKAPVSNHYLVFADGVHEMIAESSFNYCGALTGKTDFFYFGWVVLHEDNEKWLYINVQLSFKNFSIVFFFHWFSVALVLWD